MVNYLFVYLFSYTGYTRVFLIFIIYYKIYCDKLIGSVVSQRVPVGHHRMDVPQRCFRVPKLDVKPSAIKVAGGDFA